MGFEFLETLSTPSVRAAQAANGGSGYWSKFSGNPELTHLTEAEIQFIGQRDSFYMATVAENDWPYMQHRGGPQGFLRVLDDQTLGFADFRGNRQYISLGNLTVNDRAALFLMDYPNQSRLKILGHIEIRDIGTDTALAEKLAIPDYKAKVERAMLIHVTAFDWNCPQHITPRFTESELAVALAPVRDRLESLEAENAKLRAQLHKLQK
jgi:predicted pyridoxine 5'-phosphate oxidase superfamily flavin-nucleotide-binding protein